MSFNVETIKNYMVLTRIGNSVFATFSVFLAGILSEDLSGHVIEYMLAASVAIFLFMGSFAINDYYDRFADRLNGKMARPLVHGNLSEKKALQAGLLFLAISLLLSVPLGPVILIFIGLNIVVSLLYSMRLKKIFLLKNISIAYCFMATILFGSIISDVEIEPLAGYYMLMAFLVGLGYEIMIDIPDMEGDRACGISTLACCVSPRFAAAVSSAIYVVVFLLDPLPFFVQIHPALFYDLLFLVLILPVSLMYIFISRSLLNNPSRENTLGIRSRTLAVMQVGSVAYLVGFIM
ncbi:UbiA family prenyltransferase [Methanohalophilus halophilus]|uniref:Geranylgeranylglycerol-phosphate geranylgeranyltransferase n=1 Tax=Methanohalophilus halophilus TaxID=2177 RepID=A0A1L3Q1J4_9EURY|nr:UbiA family prenyltransferase [Methanohalophilus halophilus]APH38720.1 hypothetical protein BHR79_03950 [Methanohalophilus halophilus]RNI07915.1 hypothetical protein EFE40_08125 [Methanohalophilus halophilus]SDW75710.1 geranylgeranylglycerol-phosphate geranylgeranyltransferase [Methanohalophilus halophilus]